MKPEDYEKLITEIEAMFNTKGFRIAIADLKEIDQLIKNFRERQRKLITDPIDFAKKVCELSGCIYLDLRTRTRKPEIVRARQIVFIAFVHIFKMTQKGAGHLLNHDHSTYYHSFRTIKNRFKTDKEYKQIFGGLFESYPEILNNKS